ncbi:MAG: sensor histidine kinase [Anaerolineae bacterium]
MKLWYKSIDFQDEDLLARLQNRALILASIFGILGCGNALSFTIADQNVGGSITAVIVMLTLCVATVLFLMGKTQAGLKFIAVFAFLTIAIRIILFLGIDNIAIFSIFPLTALIGLLLRDEPKYISIFGLCLGAWLFLLYVLHSNQYFLTHELEVSFQLKFSVLFVSIFVLIFVLQISARNILVANKRLVQAKEAALLAQARAEKTNKTKSVFLANMSHELRTPLNAIIGYSEMIQETSDGEISDDSEKIVVSARNLLGIINSILEISKIEANTMRVERSSFDIQELVHEVAVIVAPQIQASGNRFETDIQSTKLNIFTDRQKLLQILINLLGNANKFTENGEIQLSIKNQGNTMNFLVSDTGIGIPASAQAEIFQPFQQVDVEYNRNYDGAGLGLAICNQFAQLLEGELEVVSQENYGSVFTLKIPI